MIIKITLFMQMLENDHNQWKQLIYLILTVTMKTLTNNSIHAKKNILTAKAI